MKNYKLEREVKNRVDWEKSTKETKVRIGLLPSQQKKKKKRRMRKD